MFIRGKPICFRQKVWSINRHLCYCIHMYPYQRFDHKVWFTNSHLCFGVHMYPYQPFGYKVYSINNILCYCVHMYPYQGDEVTNAELGLGGSWLSTWLFAYLLDVAMQSGRSAESATVNVTPKDQPDFRNDICITYFTRHRPEWPLICCPLGRPKQMETRANAGIFGLVVALTITLRLFLLNDVVLFADKSMKATIKSEMAATTLTVYVTSSCKLVKRLYTFLQ